MYRYLELYAILDTADSLYPALQLYTTPARVMRPVRFLRESVEASPLEWIGSQEQITLEIAIVDSDYREGETTHQELSAADMLSVVASMTPFSDFNQSPRNMYQCLSVDHEVLTRLGWRDIADVTMEDVVMTFNSALGRQEWSRVSGLVKVAHDGQLYELSNLRINAVCDAGHRWLLNTKAKPKEWTFYTVEQMLNNSNLQAEGRNGRSYGHWDRGLHRNHAVPLVGSNTNPFVPVQ